jgi:hypothetical protein
MLNRGEWYFGRNIAPDSILVTHLYFQNQMLDSIWYEKLGLIMID